MKRNFGPQNHNHAPPTGYNNSVPHFISERGNRPIADQQSYYQRRSTYSAQPAEYEPPVEILDDIQELATAIGNPELPIFDYKDEIVQAVAENQLTIVVGATGSGKSTQVPQFLFEAGYEVQLTQPRRMAAYGVAERVQDELSASLGKDAARDLVGFQTAEKSTVTVDTRITVLTDGIEHARQFNRTEALDGIVTISDEVHEWNTNTEITLAMIKRRLQHHPNERFVLMSATVDAHRIASYFADATETLPPVIEVPGRTFPIESYEKPHSTIVDEVIESATANPDQNILVFVPGKQEIEDTLDLLKTQLPSTIRKTAVLLPLHAKLSKEHQDRIYGHYEGIKIIVSTNVAQTSLTIDDVGVVIDSGQERRIELDDEEVQGLHVLPISQADCDQRKGRTGRTAPGTYILTRYDRDTEHVSYMNRSKFGTAEILRTDLSRTVLRTEAGGIDLADLDLFHPVKQSSIVLAKDSLYRLGALDDAAKITRLGELMNQFPVKPTSGRMIIESLQYSPRVRSYVAAVAASIEVGGLPYFSRDSQKAWEQLTEEKSSDFLAQLDIFIAAQTMSDWQLQENDLDVQNMKRARELHRKIAHKADASIGELIPPNEAEKEQIKTAVCAGYIDWLYMHAGGGNYELVSQSSEGRLRELSNRSVVRGQKPYLVLGTPYRVEFWKRGMPEVKHIIEGVNVIDDPTVLGRVAIDALIYNIPEKVVWSAGKLVEISRKKFNGVVDLGIEDSQPAPISEQNRLRARTHTLEGAPGHSQRKLRAIKKEVEELQHLTTIKLPKLSQEMLIEYIDRAIDEGGLDEEMIEKSLAKIVADEAISVESFVSAELQAELHKQSPPTIVVNGHNFEIKYGNGKPKIAKYSAVDIRTLPDSLQLADGRDVLFWYEKRWLTLEQLKVRALS